MHIFTTKLAFPALTPQQCWRGLVCIALCLFLAACGFRLKGISPLPFDTLYTNIPENSAFGADLRRLIVATSPNTRFESDVTQSQARLTQLAMRSEEHTSELQSLMRISYAVFCLKKKNKQQTQQHSPTITV